MSVSLIVHTHFRITQQVQPRQPNEFELVVLPSKPYPTPSPFVAAHPSRAPSIASPAKSSTTSIASIQANSRLTSSSPNQSVSSNSATSLNSHNHGMGNHGPYSPCCYSTTKPVLRPLRDTISGLRTKIPELRLDLAASTLMSLPETPVLRPKDDEEVVEIPDLDLDGCGYSFLCKSICSVGSWFNSSTQR